MRNIQVSKSTKNTFHRSGFFVSFVFPARCVGDRAAIYLRDFMSYFEMAFVDMILGLGGVDLRIISANGAHDRLGAESLQITAAESQRLRRQIRQEFLRRFLLPTLDMHLSP